MKILIVGSCRNSDLECQVEASKKIAEELGKELAFRGHKIITGGAGGLQGILVTSYKKNNGKVWKVYFALDEEKEENARPSEKTKADQEIKTGYNYAVRDAFYTGEADALVALSGKLLTFAEIIHAARNYKRKVFQLEMGENVRRIRESSELQEKVFVSYDIQKGLDFLEGKVKV